MADEETTSERDEDTQEQDEQQDNERGTDIPPEVKRALRKANKEAETLRLRLKEYEDASKSEKERAEERASSAEKAAAEANTRYLRLKVGSDAGLPPYLAERLQGSDEDEMLADAERLRDALGSGPKPPADAFDSRRSGSPSEGEPDMTARIRAQLGRT